MWFVDRLRFFFSLVIMKNIDMLEFSKEEQDLILEWLDKKWKYKNRHCDICGEVDWQLDENIKSPATYGRLKNDEEDWAQNDIITPMINIFCNNCGNIKTFSMSIIEGTKE